MLIDALFQILMNVQPTTTHVMKMLSVETLMVVLSVIVVKDGLEMVLCVKVSCFHKNLHLMKKYVEYEAVRIAVLLVKCVHKDTK